VKRNVQLTKVSKTFHFSFQKQNVLDVQNFNLQLPRNYCLKRIKASKTPEVEANFNSEKSARSGATPFAKFTIPGEKKKWTDTYNR
jgi:uncharacterized protein YlbG (UPF0298 family)